MFTVRALKVKSIPSDDPIGLFLKPPERMQSLTRAVCFSRLVGTDCEDRDFIAKILTLDDAARALPSPYVRVSGLPPPPPQDVSALKDNGRLWLGAINSDPADIMKLSLPADFYSETAEWTMKRAFSRCLRIFIENTPSGNATVHENFAIKMLYWIKCRLNPLFQSEYYPKIVYTGTAKMHESLFLYYSAGVGCDILYINSAMDMNMSFPQLQTFTHLKRIGQNRKLTLPIPEFISSPKPKPIPKPIPKPVPEPASQSPPKPVSSPALPAKPVQVAGSPISQQPGYVISQVMGQAAQPLIQGAQPPQPQKPGLWDAKETELSYEELAKFTASVVMITVFDGNKKSFKTGSGVVLNSDGLILTNWHVVCDGAYYAVNFEQDDNTYLTDAIIKYHTDHDLAIIRVDYQRRPILLAYDTKLARGQKIMAIGSPLGLFNTVSDGIISGFRQINGTDMIQFTAPTSGGSSGGALINMYGRLIGIIKGGFGEGQNLNLAIDYSVITNFVRQFI